MRTTISPRPQRPLLLAAILAALGILATVAPVGAVTNYGSTVKCRYEVTQAGTFGWTEALLQKIAVTPPKVYGKAAGQKVGWRFIVKRSMTFAQGPWVVTYRSPIQTAKASPNKAASFDTLRVGVAVPRVEDQARIYYRVTLKMFWYRPNGRIQSKASYLMPVYSTYVAGEIDPYFEECQGLLRAFFN